jgi:predicted PurR-regulated permease PerM/methanogenic corrinoid protein MtbC1
MAQRSSSRDVFHLLTVVVAVVVLCAFYFAKVVFVPLALAMLLAFVLTPLVKVCERARMGRTAATVLVVFCTLVGVCGLGWVVSRQFAVVLNQLPLYQSNLKDKIGSLVVFRSPAIRNASATMNQLSETLASPPEQPPELTGGKHVIAKTSRPTRPLPVEVIRPPSLPVESLQNVAELALQVLIVIIFTVFMLQRRENLRNRFISLAGQHRIGALTRAFDEASDRVSRYLRTQLAVNAGYGTIIGIGLHVIGLPGGLLWGVIVGILRFLPYVGPPLGGIMPVLLSMAIWQGWKMPLITVGLFVTAELTVTYVIEPTLYGAHTGVSPLAILVAAIFWTVLWGPIGLVLSTPLTVCLVVLGRHIPHLGFLPLLLGDEPVLTPETRVYQRLLAMDSDEAEQILEDQLGGKPLVEVYDTVLVPTLSLAEQDRHRNQLDEACEKFIYQEVREMAEDAGQRGKNPPEVNSTMPASSQGAGEQQEKQQFTVVCIPARDEADEIIAGMLARLLQQNSYKASCIRREPQAELIERLRFEKPDVVCISALQPFKISHARSLYRALKALSPRLEIIVGLWNFAGDTHKAAQRIGIDKASAVVNSLSDVIRLVGKPEVTESTTSLMTREA